MRIGVITKVAAPETGGNLCSALGQVFLDPQAKGNGYDSPHEEIGAALGNPMISLYVKVAVFRVGEILLLGNDDRDQFGRKPSKWDVVIQECETIFDAKRIVESFVE